MPGPLVAMIPKRDAILALRAIKPQEAREEGLRDLLREVLVQWRSARACEACKDLIGRAEAALAASSQPPACPECKRLREALDAVLEFDVNESGDYGERTIAGDATEPIPVTVASILDRPTLLLARPHDNSGDDNE